MKPQIQRNLHRPAEGVWGDCHRACVASILEIPYEEVPHFGEGGPTAEEFQARERRFLVARGYVPIVVAYLGDVAVEKILDVVGFMNPDTYYLLGGLSVNGTPHTVVCLNDRVTHNPNGAAIVGPIDEFYYVTFIGSGIALHT